LTCSAMISFVGRSRTSGRLNFSSLLYFLAYFILIFYSSPNSFFHHSVVKHLCPLLVGDTV